MPRVKVPKPQTTIATDIQLFAKAYFNIELTSYQLEYISLIATGKKHIVSIFPRNRDGRSTANEVVLAYLQEGLRPNGRARLPKHHLPPIDKKQMKKLTQEGKILALIERPGGAYNFELSRYALKYTSVISALRKDGHAIVAERQYLKNGNASNTYLYRIAGKQ